MRNRDRAGLSSASATAPGGNTDTNETPYFLAALDEQREVLAVETYEDVAHGEEICVFGRASNEGHCIHVAWLDNLCDGAHHMVEMDADVMTEGDSGGPWFRGTRAFGIHHGPC